MCADCLDSSGLYVIGRRLTSGVALALDQPPESIRKEMESLMEQLEADGIEAKRQVKVAVHVPVLSYTCWCDTQTPVLLVCNTRLSSKFCDCTLYFALSLRLAIARAEPRPPPPLFAVGTSVSCEYYG